MRRWRSTSSTCNDARSAARALAVAVLGLLASCATARPAGTSGFGLDSAPYRACVAGDLDACAAHAASGAESETSAGQRAALVAYQYGCLLDHAPSCAGLARILGPVGGDPASGDRFLDALESACAGTEPSACVELARHSSGRRAQDLYRRACDADYGPGCFELGKTIRKIWKVEQQLTEGIALQEKACTLGTIDGCVAAGQAYLFGSGVEQDTARGLEMLERGCTKDEGAGCATLAGIYAEGIGVGADPERAQAYADLDARHRAAQEEKPNARALAFVVYADACSHGDVLGCFDTAWFRAEGADVERNITLARHLFDDACQAGLQPACGRWKAIDGGDP